jgi:5-methylcytosine-specific restriction endonuclease McrA
LKTHASRLNVKKRQLKEKQRAPFTPAGRQKVIRRNQELNEGRTVCSSCGRETSPSQQSQAGVTPQDNETNVDHIYPRSQMGDGDPDTNGQLLCRACNLQKGDSLPDGSIEPAGPLGPVDPTVEPIEDPFIIDFLF